MLEDGQPRKLKVFYKAVETGEEFDGEYNTVWRFQFKLPLRNFVCLN